MAESPQERYEQVREILQEAILRDYPNPERKDCRGGDVLRRLARRRRPIRDADWEHVTHCSPCYREFLELRAEVLEREQRGRAIRRWALITASVILVAWISGYWLLRNRPGSLARRPAPPAPTAENRTMVTAVLNLESQSPTRGTENPPAGGLQHLPRSRVALSIYLPFGSEPGLYELRVLNDNPDSPPISTYTGLAQIEDGLTVLRISGDFSTVPTGTYILALRRAAASWRYYPIAIG